MAKPKTKKSVTKPTKTKPIQEEVPDVPATAEMEEDTQEAARDKISSSSENKENKKPGPGSKQKRAGLVFPIIRMRQILKKGKKSRRV